MARPSSVKVMVGVSLVPVVSPKSRAAAVM